LSHYFNQQSTQSLTSRIYSGTLAPQSTTFASWLKKNIETDRWVCSAQLKGAAG
jgi:hypothetical protein